MLRENNYYVVITISLLTCAKVATIKPNAKDISTIAGLDVKLIIVPQPMRTKRNVPINSAHKALHIFVLSVISDKPIIPSAPVKTK